MIRKKTSGVITVFISFMLAGIIGLSSLVLEGGRLQAAKTQLDEANGSAGYSMIAAFDSKLFERFGILAIDEDISNVGRYRTYLDFNSDRSGAYKGNNISTLYTVRSAEMQTMYNLTYPSILKRQILARAKYNVIPQDFVLNYYNADHFTADLQKKINYITERLSVALSGGAGSANDIPANMQSAFSNMYEAFKDIKRYDEEYGVVISGADSSILPSVSGTVESSIDNADAAEISAAVADAYSVIGSAAGVLDSAVENTYSEIDASADVSFMKNGLNKMTSPENISSNARTIISDCRRLMQNINAAFNVLKSDLDGNLLLNSYIAGYFSNKNFRIEEYSGPVKGTKGSLGSGTFVSACTEYVFGGNASETSNQAAAYNYVMAVRMINNLYSVLTVSNSLKISSAASVAAHIAWAYYESFIDSELLFKYNAVVPFAKYNMIMPINNIDKVNNAFTTKDFLNAMKGLGILVDGNFYINGADAFDYTDALAVGLWFVPNSTKLLRIADLIQLEMRSYESYVENSGASFMMAEKNTVCRVKCTGSLNSVLPVISLGGDGTAQGTSFQSIKYVSY